MEETRQEVNGTGVTDWVPCQNTEGNWKQKTPKMTKVEQNKNKNWSFSHCKHQEICEN